jgi:hypothetical protein
LHQFNLFTHFLVYPHHTALFVGTTTKAIVHMGVLAGSQPLLYLSRLAKRTAWLWDKVARMVRRSTIRTVSVEVVKGKGVVRLFLENLGLFCKRLLTEASDVSCSYQSWFFDVGII